MRKCHSIYATPALAGSSKPNHAFLSKHQGIVASKFRMSSVHGGSNDHDFKILIFFVKVRIGSTISKERTPRLH